MKRMGKKRVAVLISGRGSNMTALIEAARANDYPAEIALVVSNRPEAAGLSRAREAGVATAIVDHRPFGETARRSSARLTQSFGRSGSIWCAWPDLCGF